MLLDRVRIEPITLKEKNKQIKYGLCFKKNRQTSIIYTSNQDIYAKFSVKLNKLCILNGFQETFSIEKLIGKGSFGKVYFFL